MAADETIRVGLNFDLSDAQQKLELFKSTFEGLKQSFQDAPNATNMFNQGLDRSLDLVDMMSKKIEKVNKSGNTNDPSFQQSITSGLEELDALSRLFSNKGSFDLSASMASFKSLSATVQKELDSITQEISNMIRSNIHSLKSSTIAGMTNELMATDYAQEIFSKTRHIGSKDFANYIKMMLPNVAPSYLLDDYNQVRYGTTHLGSRTANPIDIIPNSFKTSFKSKSYIGTLKPESSGYLQADYRNIIRNMIMENDAALRAAEATEGMMRYKKNGRASLAYNISSEMYDSFRKNLFNDFVRRASGNVSNRIDIFDEALDGSEKRKLIARMTSSSTGRVLRAMDQLEQIDGENAWGDALSKKAYEDLEKEAKRSLEQYEIAKYKFGDLVKGDAKTKRVTLSESQNTRMLGLSGHHNEFTDKVLLVSTDGYDKTDAKQQAYMDALLSGKPVEIPGTGKSYIRQNVHGTGEHTVIRMVEADEYNRIRKQEETWAKKNGFITDDGKGANYWNDFIPDDYDFKSVQALRKHYDATGKGWSPGYKMPGNFNDRRFGVVDLSKVLDDGTKQKLADGLGWFAGGVLPIDDFQGRMGVAGKGTFHRLKGFSTLGEWARAVGLANEDGRFILPGPRGDVDLTDMSGMTDVSTIKNTQAYDNFQTVNEYNDAFTKMLQRYGMSVMQSYEDAETRARGIGSQAMAFIKLSPKLQNEQIKEYTRRMHLLDTEAGVKEYLLGDPDSYLAEKVKTGEMTVNDPVIQSWVRAERESLANRFASGEWIDFGDQPSVINQKANKSPIASIYGLQTDVDRKTLLDNIRKKYKEKTKTDLSLSDEDLAGVFALDAGKIVDFSRVNDDDVSVIRSPSGFGNFVAGKNYAKIAKSIYEAFGISTKGLYLSEPDMFKLGGADFDGDAVKTLYGDIGAAVKEAAELHDQAIAALGQIPGITTKDVKLPDVENYKDSALQARLNLESAMDAGLHMGSASSAGMRAATIDLFNPNNRDFLIAALQSNAAYRDTTAEVKAATETEITQQMKDALYMNAQWSKLPTRYERFFNVTGQNDLDVPDEADIATIRIGDKDVKINLDELRKVDFDKINFRSVYSGADLGGLRSAMSVSNLGVDTTKAQALLQALDTNIGYGNAGEKTKALMQNLRIMKVMDIVNPGAIMSDEELDNLEKMTSQAEKEVRKQATELSQGKKIQLSDGSEVSYDAYVQKKLNEYGISAAKTFINHGIHARSLRNIYGDEATEYFPEFFDPARQALTLPNRAEETELQRVNAEEQQKIIEAREQEIKQIDQEIKARQDRVKNIQAEINDDTSIAKRRDDLDKEITEEKARLQKEQETFLAGYIEKKQQEIDDSPIPGSFKMPTREELETSIAQNQDAITQEEAKIKAAKAEIARYKELYKQNKNYVPGANLSEWGPVAAAQAQIQESENRIKHSRDIIDKTQNTINAFYTPPTSKRLEELVRERESLSETPEQTRLSQEIRDLEQQKMKAEQQKENAASEIKKIYDYISAQEQYNELSGRADDFSNNLYSNIRKKEQKLAETPQAELYYNRNYGMAKALQGRLKQFSESDVFKELPPDFQQDILERVNGENSILNMVDQDFADTAELKAKQLSERFSKANRKKSGRASSIALAFEQYDKEIQTVQGYRDKLENNLQTKVYTKEQRETLGQNLVNADKFLSDARKEANQLKITDITSVLDKIQNETITNPFEKLTKGAQEAKENVDALVELLKETYKNQGLSDEEIAEQIKPYNGLSSRIGAKLELQQQQQQIAFNRQARQTEQMIDQADRLKMHRTGYYDNTVFGRAMRERDQEVLQRKAFDNQYQTQIEEFRLMQRQATDGNGKIIDQAQYDHATSQINRLTEAMNKNKDAMEDLQSGGGLTSRVFAQLGLSVANLANRFGRQLFQKALQEAKRFVMEYDASMTEIQMITLKSDEEMSKLGSGLIKQAKDLKVSISDITKAASALYRQGLNDQQVSERLEIVSKFSKVAGVDTTAATKLITTAINTGLVQNAQQATDIVTALGDNAATNAAEIQKGVEKAGAAAAADGTTFGQLAAMLTAITSTTQIGGRVAGTTMNTIFSRMNKIGTNELVYDENGNAISGSAISKLLAAQGIKTYEGSNKRPTFDVLMELAQKWEKMSDAAQQQIATAIAGTRQYSNFSAIMNGMAEGDVDRYMELVGESAGITDKKYAAYVDSLNASLVNLRNTFDQLINDLTQTGTLTSIFDGVQLMVQGLDNIVNSAGRLPAVLAALIPIAGAMLMMHSGGNWTMLGVGLGMLAVGGIGLAIAGASSTPQKTANEVWEDSRKISQDRYDTQMSGINRARELNEKGSDRTAAEEREFNLLMKRYAAYASVSVDTTALDDSASDTTESVDQLVSSVNSLGQSAQTASVLTKQSADAILKNAERQVQNAEYAQFYNNVAGTISDKIIADLVTKQKEVNEQGILTSRQFSTSGLWSIEEDTNGNLYVNPSDPDQFKRALLYFIDQNASRKDGLTRTWTEINGDNGPLNAIAELFYQASTNGYMNGTEYERYTLNQWRQEMTTSKQRVLGAAPYFSYGNRMNSNAIQGLINYLKNTELGLINQNNYMMTTLEESFSEVLQDIVPDDDLRSFLASSLTQDYFQAGYAGYRDEDIEALIFDMLGGHTFRSIEETLYFIMQYAASHGYRSSTAELAQYDLEDPGELGYFKDANGQTYSYQQVKDRIDDINEQIATRSKIFDLVNQKGETVQSFDQETYGEKAYQYATAMQEKSPRPGFIDENGNYHFYPVAAARDQALEDYKLTNGVYNGQYTIQEARYNEDAARFEMQDVLKPFYHRSYQAIEDEYNKALTKRYAAVMPNSPPLFYFNDEDSAIQFVAKENERILSEYEQAMTDYQNNTIAQWINPLTNEQVYGPITTVLEAAQQFEQTYPYAMSMGDGTTVWLKSKNDNEGLSIPYRTTYSFEGQRYGSLTDLLTENTNKWLTYENGTHQMPMNYDRYMQTQYGGRDTVRQFYNLLGLLDEDKTLQYKKAMDAYSDMLDLEYIYGKSNMSEFYNSLLNRLFDGGLIDEAMYNTWNGYTDNFVQHIQDLHPEDVFEWSLDLLSSEIDQMVHGIQAYDVEYHPQRIDVLESPENPPIQPNTLTVVDTLVSELETTYLGIADATQEELSIRERYNQSLVETLEESKKQFTAVKNYFMSNVAAGESQWQTANRYATVADQMINMLNEHNFESVQELFTYVNDNAVTQWSELNQDAEFAHLMSSIIQDNGKILSAPENIIDTLLTFLYSKSSVYANRQVAFNTKATMANGLINDMGNQYSFATKELMENAYETTVDQQIAEMLGKAGITTGIIAADVQPNTLIVTDWLQENGKQITDDNIQSVLNATDDLYIDFMKEKYAAALTPEEYRQVLGDAYSDEKYTAYKAAYDKIASSGFEPSMSEEDYNAALNVTMAQLGLIRYNEETQEFADVFGTSAKDYRKQHSYENFVAGERLAYVQSLLDARENVQSLTLDEWKKENNAMFADPYAIEYLQEIIGDNLAGKVLSKTTFSDMESQYVAQLLSNYSYGITGLTDIQKTQGARQLFNAVKNGNISALYAENDSGMLQQYAGSMEGLSELIVMMRVLEDAGIDLKKTSIGGLRAHANDLDSILAEHGGSKAFLKAYRSAVAADSLAQYVQDYDYKSVSDLYNQLHSESAVERLGALQKTAGSVMGIQTANWALSQLDVLNSFGRQDSTVIDLLANATGYSKDQISDMWKKEGGYATREKLKEALQNQESELIDVLIKSLTATTQGLQIDGTRNSAELAQKLREQGDEVAADMVELIGATLKDGVVEIGDFGTTSGRKTLQEVEDEARYADRLEAEQKSLLYGKNGVFGIPFYTQYDQTRYKDWANGVANDKINWEYVDPTLRSLIMMNGKGNEMVTGSMINDAFMNWMYGRETTSNQKAGYLEALFGAANGNASAMASMYQTWAMDPEQYESQLTLFKLLDTEGTLAKSFDPAAIESADEALRDFLETLRKTAIIESGEFGDNTEEVSQNLDYFSKNAKKAQQSAKAFNQTLTAVTNNQFFRNRWNAGDRSEETISNIANMLNLSEAMVSDKQNEGLISKLLDESYDEDIGAIETWAQAAGANLTAELQKVLSQDGVSLKGFGIDVSNGPVVFDTSAMEAMLDEETAAAQARMIELLEAYGISAHYEVGTDDKDNVFAKLVIDSLGAGHRSSGGGGGGGKSAADILLERQQRSAKINEHEIKMVQYRESYYQEDGQLGNYGLMIAEEQRIRERYQKRLQEHLNELKAEMGKTAKESDDWYKLRDAILSAEEAMEENTNAIEENKRKLEENRQAILKLHTDLEKEVQHEIETRIQEERTRLEATASMEQTIVDIIRQRYQEEWDLIKKDIDKKKEALEEEKRLIDERLNARKNAEDEAQKYEELQEMQRQLAMISMDSTRTKDAIEMRKKIAELQSEIAWDVAEDEAEATKEGIDDQIEAYDQFVTSGDEALQEFLEDANNFADEVTDILGKSHDDLIDWLKTNSEEFKNSLDNTQETMVQGWTDTWKQMKGIVDTYWDEINTVLSSKDKFIEYMQQSTSYMNASQDEQAQMVYNWEQMYDNWFKAQDTSAEYTHDDTWMDNVSQSQNTYQPQQTNDYKAESKAIVDAIRNIDLGGTISNVVSTVQSGLSSAVSGLLNAGSSILSGLGFKRYAGGGLVDYTGLAWVDGTKTRPEGFLNADDTDSIRKMLDLFSYIKSPAMSLYDSSRLGDSFNSIGEIQVTINEAEINDDADYEEVAKRVGREFAKELEKQGFSTVNYNF